MKADPAYWAANVAGLDDPSLLRFLDACETRRDKYQVALDAATREAERRRLIKKDGATHEAAWRRLIKKDGAKAPPKSGRGRETA